jgi:predicted dehydrogenase
MVALTRVDILLVGIGGYGRTYVNLLAPLRAANQVRLVGVVDPVAARALDYAALVADGVPMWADFDGCRAAGVTADLAVIASPIQFHCEQTCQALALGMNVLCEKPVAATVVETERMARARDAAGRLLAIGYQWSYADAIRKLKVDLLAGRYGQPRRFRTWTSWPRTSAYYGRNGWAGCIRDGAGRTVNDSPVSNATAHYLHNMLYLLGDDVGRAAAPRQVTAELYRANAIENFDTACLRVLTERGVEVYFSTAHCVDEQQGPDFVLECDAGAVTYHHGVNASIVGTMRDGERREYGDPNVDVGGKFAFALEAVRAGRTDTICGLEAAAMHTRVVEALQQMNVRTFAADAVDHRETKPGEILTFVPGLSAAMRTCFDTGKLFSEAGYAWAQPAQTVTL